MIKLLDNRLALNAQTVFIAIGDYLASVFEKTDVAKSLRGIGTVDLPAHFGLSDSDANGLVDGMVNILINSVFLGSKITPNGGSLTIRAVATDWEKYTSLPGAKYISEKSGIEIPVVEWMLVNPDIDIGQAAYDIVFRGDSAQFDTVIQTNSRSGRAIMVSLQDLGGSGGYALPDILRHNSGMNFIEFAIGQKDVARRCAEILMEGVT
jgi:hypothetical protein